MVFLLRFMYFRYQRWPYSYKNGDRLVLNFVFLHLVTIFLIVRDLIIKFYPNCGLPLHYTKKEDIIIGAVLLLCAPFIICRFIGKEKDLAKMKADEFGVLSDKPLVGTLVFWLYLIVSFALPFLAMAIHHKLGFDKVPYENHFIYHWDQDVDKTY